MIKKMEHVINQGKRAESYAIHKNATLPARLPSKKRKEVTKVA